MTKKLVDKLIAWYEKTITILKSERMDIYKVRAITQERKVQLGICHCIQSRADLRKHCKEPCEDKWIRSFRTIWWFHSYPNRSKTKRAVITQLQKRIDRLKTFK